MVIVCIRSIYRMTKLQTIKCRLGIHNPTNLQRSFSIDSRKSPISISICNIVCRSCYQSLDTLYSQAYVIMLERMTPEPIAIFNHLSVFISEYDPNFTVIRPMSISARFPVELGIAYCYRCKHFVHATAIMGSCDAAMYVCSKCNSPHLIDNVTKETYVGHGNKNSIWNTYYKTLFSFSKNMRFELEYLDINTTTTL